MRFYRCDGNPEKDAPARMPTIQRRMTSYRCDGNPEKDAAYSNDGCSQKHAYLKERWRSKQVQRKNSGLLD
jgi:hypothetical protein